MATASISASINLNTGNLTVTDTSDFVSQSVALIDVNGNVEVINPSGNIIYQSTTYAFETGTAQAGNATSLTLAVGATSQNIAGYYLLATGGTGAGQAPRITAYNGSTKVATFATVGTPFDATTTYRIVFADIFLAADLSNQPTISLYTNGSLEAGTYTINYSVYDSNLGVYYVATTTVDYDFVLPTVVIEHTVDCLSPLLASFDATVYTVNGIAPTSLTRTHTINYPVLTPPISAVTGATANLYTSILYNYGTYTTQISSVVSWTLTDGTVVTATLTGSQEVKVQCEQWLCTVYCCIKSIYNLWQQYQVTNPTRAAEYLNIWLQVTSLATQIQSAYFCGDSDAVAGYVLQLRTIANCNEGCSCDDGTPTLIQGLGNITNTYDVQSTTPNWLTVTDTVSGNSTTFDLALTNAAITALTVGNVVTADTNTKVTVTGTGNSASFAVKGATVTGGNGIGSTFSGGTTTPDYSIRLANLLDSQFIDNATTGTVLEVLKTYTLPIGRLAVDAGRLKVKALFSVTPNSSAKTVSVRVNSTDIFTSINANDKNIVYVYFEYELYREDSTTLKVMVNCWRAIGFIGNTIYELKNLPAANITCNDLDAATNTINVTGDSSVTGDIVSKDFSIEYLGK
jgi:hypothetical protein